MTSFMGPMAPPPAAPPQPQALDIRTDPNRRQQFKQFMKQRTSMAPMVSAPIAQPPMPMMPMMQPSMPMGGQDIDIFNPVNLHEGGLVPSLNSLQQQAAQFSQQLQNTVMGDSPGEGMGGGFGGSFNSGGGMGGGGFSSPGFTTNTTSGGLVPSGLKSVSPPPDANVSDFFQNFNNTNSGESYMKMSDHPAFTSEPRPLAFTSEEDFLNFNSNQTPNDPNLQGGQQGGMQQAVVNPQVDPNPFISGQLPNNTRSELSSDSPFFNVPEAGTGQRLPSDSSALGGGVSNLIANNPDLSGIGGIGNFAGNLLMRNKGGAVPPRRTDIRGQDHMLSYITPDEADILKALGGSGEAGPMGIPAYIGDNEGGQSSSGASEGDVGDNSSEGMGEGQDNTGIADAAGYGSGSSDTSNSDADEIGDAIADIAAAEIAGQMADDRAADAAARNRAVRDAFATTTTGKPIGTKSGYLSKENATDEQIAAGYKALGLPDPKSDLASQDVEASYGVPVGIASVTGVPTERLSSNKTGLLGLDPQDLLAMSLAPQNMQVLGTPTNVGMTVQTAYGPMSVPEMNMSIANQTGLSGPNLAAVETALANPVSAPSSNALGQLSAGQLAAMDLNTPSMVDAETDVMARDLSDMNRAGYTGGLPDGLGFGTNLSTGTDFTTNLAGTTEAQRAEMPGYLDNLATDKLTGFLAQDPYGYEIDPVTGTITGTIGAPSRIGITGNLLAGLQDMIMGPPKDSRDLVERGVYSGYGAGYDALGESGAAGGDGPSQQVKAPTDPCPDGFVMKDGACTPIDTGSGVPNQIGGMIPPTRPIAPVIVPSSRFQGYSLQGPVGYGSPIAGQAAPSVASNAAMYQQMMNQQGMRPPLRLEDGGAVPPRNVEISGQDHMLSYITPDEADILKSLGGSGNPGPMGIPSFDGAADEMSNFYSVPVDMTGTGRTHDEQIFRKVYIGSNLDTVANRQAGNASLANIDGPPGFLPGARGPDYTGGDTAKYFTTYGAGGGFGGGGGGGDDDGDADSMGRLGDVDPVAPDPVDPDAYNPIMDVVVPSTRLEDFPASAPPSVIGQSVPMQLQGPVGYGSPEVGQMAPSVVSNAAMYQDMLSQPFPLNFQQGGSVSSNLDMAADNFLKALMPAA